MQNDHQTHHNHKEIETALNNMQKDQTELNTYTKTHKTTTNGCKTTTISQKTAKKTLKKATKRQIMD